MPDYVGFGARLTAGAIDALVLFVVAAPLALAGFSGLLLESLLPALAVIYFWRRYGATPGKGAVYARIVDARTRGTLSTGQCVARALGYLLSSIPLFLGFVWIAIDRRKQGWHDKIAGTLVIYDDD